MSVEIEEQEPLAKLELTHYEIKAIEAALEVTIDHFPPERAMDDLDRMMMAVVRSALAKTKWAHDAICHDEKG